MGSLWNPTNNTKEEINNIKRPENEWFIGFFKKRNLKIVVTNSYKKLSGKLCVITGEIHKESILNSRTEKESKWTI